MSLFLWVRSCCGRISHFQFFSVRKKTFKELKDLEREPLRYCKGDGKVTFTRPFLTLGKVNFDEHVNVLERYSKGDISYAFTKP